MPDEPRPEDESLERDEDLDRELDEFEAELFKAVGDGRTEDQRDRGADDLPVPELPTDEDIEARLSRVIKEAEAYLGPIQGSSLEPHELDEIEKGLPAEERSRFHDEHPDLAQRLKELESRAKQSNQIQRDRVRKRRLTSGAEGDSARGLGIGLSVAYTIIGGPLAGAAIGWMIDSNLGTDSWTGICVIIGAVVGIAMALLILNRTQSDR